MRLSRSELYALVWCEPMNRLAERFGISKMGLAKRCRKSSIPVSGRGYRARKAAGQRVRVKPRAEQLAGDGDNARQFYFELLVRRARTRGALRGDGGRVRCGTRRAACRQPSRASLPVDLMEPIRLGIDAYALRLLESKTFLAPESFEIREDAGRLMPTLTGPLTATGPKWGRSLAPMADRVAAHFASTTAVLGRVPARNEKRWLAVNRCGCILATAYILGVYVWDRWPEFFRDSTVPRRASESRALDAAHRLILFAERTRTRAEPSHPCASESADLVGSPSNALERKSKSSNGAPLTSWALESRFLR